MAEFCLDAEGNPVSEFETFTKCRYISSSEAAWHLCAFDINGGEPSVTAITVHPPCGDRVYFTDRSTEASVRRAVAGRVSTQTRFLLRPRLPEFDGLSYVQYHELYNHDKPSSAPRTLRCDPDELPGAQQHMVWRRTTDHVARVHDLRPSAGQVFYLRKLLLSTPGVRSYRELATVSGVTYYNLQGDPQARSGGGGAQAHGACGGGSESSQPEAPLSEDQRRAVANAHLPLDRFDATLDVLHAPASLYDFHAAAVARGLVCTTHEEAECMSDAIECGVLHPGGLRRLFILLLVEGTGGESVDTPQELFDRYHDAMSLDFVTSTTAHRNVVHDSATVRTQRLLFALSVLAAREGRTLSDLGLPSMDPAYRHHVDTGILSGGISGGRGGTNRGEWTAAQYAADAAIRLPMLRAVPDQAAVFDRVMALCDPGSGGGAVFCDAAAGRGKSFVLHSLISHLRGSGRPVYVTATSALVASMFPGGMTCHTGFGLPPDIDPDSAPEQVASRLPLGGEKAAQLREAHLIIMDEVGMLLGVHLAILDRLLRTLTGMYGTVYPVK